MKLGHSLEYFTLNKGNAGGQVLERYKFLIRIRDTDIKCKFSVHKLSKFTKPWRESVIFKVI